VLEEVWVQIRGVPPKWSKWRTFRQLASSLGKMVEIGWNSLFSGFFSMARVKITCKDPSKITNKRLFEMMNSLYVIYFKIEGSAEVGIDDDEDGGDNEDPSQGDDNGMEEFHHESLPGPEAPGDKKQEGFSDGGKFIQCTSSSNRDSSNRKVAS
jgi:hypothetical protein